ncbi:MAG: hypothetical protein HZC51_03930, partial [Nitrospirae bacterium]|nr:hypothetical protein [Nitrospirota bacterium]
NAYLTPLIGGSGGGGGAYYPSTRGSYGGGGSGAILIASSGTINVTGYIYACGGYGGIYSTDGYENGTYFGGGGGGGGGMIRLIADTITGEGTIQATGGSGGDQTYSSNTSYWDGGDGSSGRIRLEADHLLRVANTNPSYQFGYPTAVTFPDGIPSLTITSIGGVPAPEGAIGDFEYPDVNLPYGTQNPVTVGITAANIPLTTAVTVTVRVSPRKGTESTATSTALSGTTESSTATASVNLPASEPAIISVYVSVPVVAMFGDGPVYAEGEKVNEIKVSSTMGGGSELSYITESGREVLARLY